MRSPKIRVVVCAGLALALTGLSVWYIARVAASSAATSQSKGHAAAKTNAQADVVAAGTVFKQAVAAYHASPTPENAAAVDKARAAYDQSIVVRVGEIKGRLSQLFPKTSFSHADYGKKPEARQPAASVEAEALLTELRSYDPPVPVQNDVGARPTGQTISQSSSQAITQGSSVSCNNSMGHSDNSYWRAFNLPALGIVNQFKVSSVQIGVEKAEAAAGSQSITVRLYRSTSGVFPTCTRDLLSGANFNVTDQTGKIIDVPIAADVPAGSELIVEVFTPNGQAKGNLFFIGANAAPESGPSYISACGISTPTPMAELGFSSKIVLNILGQQIEGVGGGGGAEIISLGAPLINETCTPENGELDPGENVTVSFCVQNIGSANTINLVGTLQNTGGVTGASGPQNYGVVVAGGPPVCRTFTFTAAGVCGGTVTASIQFQDGATNLGTLPYLPFTLGLPATTFSESFDFLTVPNLPAGWTATVVAGPPGTVNWVTSNAGAPAPPADQGPNSAFVPDPAVVTDVVLDTPTIAITSSSAKLLFRHNFDLESTFDGAVLEIAIGAGAFTDIITAGGSFTQGSYNSTISTAFGSPIGGRNAWSGSSAGFITTIVNLPAAAAGQNVKLRFRRATDTSVSQVGWRVDTIFVSDGFNCCAPAGTLCAENFDGVTAPALPTGWTATTAIDCAGSFASDPWATSNVGTPAPPADTAPNAAIANEPNCISDELLDTPLFNVIATTATVTFRRNNNLENGFDGAVLEVSINGGAFQDIIAAGGSFATGGYNGVISVNFGSPIAGRNAWTGSTGGFVTTTVNIPAVANGGNIRLRFRRATDSSVSGQGIRIDSLVSTGTNCGGATCTSITCPANVTQSNDLDQCGAVVNYPPPTTSGSCAAPTCSPASGSFFPVGTTTVTCTTTGPPQLTCTFTVTVVDTQPPTITCPANITVVTNQDCAAAGGGACQVVTFPPPTATDNCPGVTTACVPPSGTCLPPGVTTVTCTATDASGNTATCSFTVTVFDVAVQDDSDPSIVLLWNSVTGEYRFCCRGTTFTGVGKATIQGCVFTLQHNPADRRVLGRVDKAVHAGSASIQAPAGTIRCTITDRNTLNDTLQSACQ
jgi:HYR domain-containing protein